MKKNVLIVALVLLVALVGCAEHECSWKEVGSTAPTCTADGERVFKCEGCGATRTEKLDKLPHELSDDGWTFNGEKFKYEQKCASCGETQYKEIESGVRVQGIAGFEDRLFATANEAYATIKAFLQNKGGVDDDPYIEESLTNEEFDGVFTENGKITWVVYGEQDLIESSEKPYLLTFGRVSAHYNHDRHISGVTITGGNEKAKINCKSEEDRGSSWHFYSVAQETGQKNNDDVGFSLVFKNITIDAIDDKMNLVPNTNHKAGDYFEFENCRIKGFLKALGQKYSLVVKNCSIETPDNSYAIFVQGSTYTTEAKAEIRNTTITGSRGVNIDQTTAEAKIVGNTFVNCGNLSDNEDNNYYGVIQVTKGANVLVEGNTIENCKGNAIWVWSSKGTGAFKGNLTVNDNVINNCSYAFADYGNTYTLESSGNKISGTNVDKCFARVVEGESVVYKEIDATTKLK